MKRSFAILMSILLIVSLTFGSFETALAEQKVTRIRTLDKGASLRNSSVNGTKIGSVHMNTELEVYDQDNGWFYVYYNGTYGWVYKGQVEILEIETVASDPVKRTSNTASKKSSGKTSQSFVGGELRDMGVPYIGKTVFRQNMMNMVVFWVQTQLKATGIWYQGYQWDVTGNLGDHTMSEISSFMQSMGYRGHTGVVNQDVIDALASYLGSDIVPVYVGGFYNGMSTIMQRDSWGTMAQIVSNLRDMVPRETIGARWIQCVLSYLGYYRSGIDGKYGEGTENAVKKYQKDHGFQERDYVTLGIARSMLEQYYYSGGNVNRLP